MTQHIEQALEAISLEKQALEQKQSALQQELFALTGQLKTLSLSYRQLSKVCGKEQNGEVGIYTGMTLTDAVQDVLSTWDKPMTTAQIAHALIEGGYLSTSSRFNSMVHSIMKRRAETFKRTTDGKCWMLCSQVLEIEEEIEETDIAEIDDTETEQQTTEVSETEDEDAIEKLAQVFAKTKTLTISKEKVGE
ncbi:hypothetical protein Cva_01480 [Caedimonas varicaedens]|uniref:Uncharacterized protein n=1 Tax=Caedimonas varicaedens TaxID=1629334 RepID=A0A0K8ME54_9PROT|nr:hypothetical protein Cva_01480 [Caedimonas varicaedens]